MRGGEEGEVFPRRGEVPPVANDQAVAPRKQNIVYRYCIIITAATHTSQITNELCSWMMPSCRRVN